MIRFAAILILASAYFSPAHALPVDHLIAFERDVPVLVSQDASNLELDALAEGLRLRDEAVAQTPISAAGPSKSSIADAGEHAQTARFFPAEQDNKIAPGFLTGDRTVTVPLPGSFWLFAVALAAGLLLQRRQDVKER